MNSKIVEMHSGKSQRLVYIRARSLVRKLTVVNDVSSRMTTERMTGLAEGVAAGASPRLAGRALVGRPPRITSIKGRGARTRELSRRKTLNALT